MEDFNKFDNKLYNKLELEYSLLQSTFLMNYYSNNIDIDNYNLKPKIKKTFFKQLYFSKNNWQIWFSMILPMLFLFIYSFVNSYNSGCCSFI